MVDESRVGGGREKILRIIPFKEKKYMDVSHYEFTHVDYIPIAINCIEDITIKLYSDYGEYLPLVDGRCYVKLHFRKKAK